MQRIERVLNTAVLRATPLAGGCVSDVQRLDLADGRSVVAKIGDASAALAIEGWMLGYLAERSDLPVPRVLHCEDSLLIMERIEHDSCGDAAEDAAAHLAALHSITSSTFGLERDTLIGSLIQPNTPSTTWVSFFRDRRLLHFAHVAVERGRLDPRVLSAIDRLASRLGEWLADRVAPSLIHGDVWGGNVLVHQGRVAAFVDPAIHFADPEIELAFTTLFTTFSERFYRRYHELRPIAPGFFEERRDLYNLYPLLVHTVLFGGSYAAAVERTVRRFVG